MKREIHFLKTQFNLLGKTFGVTLKWEGTAAYLEHLPHVLKLISVCRGILIACLGSLLLEHLLCQDLFWPLSDNASGPVG